MTMGKVYLVGAGPGDPKLITVRGMEALMRADVVVYDRLASPRLLKYMKPDAKKIYVGKLPDRHTLKQEEINQLLLELAQSGLTVTRLKGGDPAVFGRVGEEALTLAEHGVSFEMVPGVTSAIAVPAYAGIPVTHRGLTSSFAIVTGHECPKKDDTDIDWQKLATATGTIIFLMGIKNLDFICEQMMECGRNPDTPVAVIRWGTCSEQQTVTGTLTTIVERVRNAGLSAPAITIVGEVVRLREQLAWFEQRPLFGRKIVVTRARSQASELVQMIEEQGGEALEFPVIETKPIGDVDGLAVIAATVRNIDQYDWLVFSSVNGVQSFFRALSEQATDIRKVRARIAAVGAKTAAKLAEFGVIADMIPEQQQAEGLVEMFASGAKGRVLLARAKVARDVLPSRLVELGYQVDDVAFYQTEPAAEQDEYVIQQLLEQQVHAITFTSSSTVTNFLQVMKNYNYQPSLACQIVCIGPITAETARAAGLPVTLIAEQASIESLLQSLLFAETK